MKVKLGAALKKAFTCALRQEKSLKLFLEDGERFRWITVHRSVQLRGFCIGKKNWEMIDTINGATSSAIIYSIAETAKGQ